MCIYCNNLCSNIFWQILEQKPFHYVFSVKMELTTGWRRVLVLSFLMIGVSICLPNIRKGEEDSWGSSLSEDRRHHLDTSFLHDSVTLKMVINHHCWYFQWGKPLRDSRKVSQPWRQKECASPWSRCWVSDEFNDFPITFIKLFNVIILPINCFYHVLETRLLSSYWWWSDCSKSSLLHYISDDNLPNCVRWWSGDGPHPRGGWHWLPCVQHSPRHWLWLRCPG